VRKNDYFVGVPGNPPLGLVVDCPAADFCALVRASRVDCYPACPADWPRSTRSTSSWFVPIMEGRGMWLDFNRCWPPDAPA
jgi:hypothetical protein